MDPTTVGSSRPSETPEQSEQSSDQYESENMDSTGSSALQGSRDREAVAAWRTNWQKRVEAAERRAAEREVAIQQEKEKRAKEKRGKDHASSQIPREVQRPVASERDTSGKASGYATQPSREVARREIFEVAARASCGSEGEEADA